MTIRIIWLTLLLVLVTSCYASSYELVVDDSELLHDSLVTGNVSVGRILFDKRLVNQTTFHLNNLSSLNIFRGDSVCNNGSVAWNVHNTTIMNPGACREFSTTSNYSVSDSQNLTATFTIQEPTYPSAVISTTDSQFMITATNSSILVDKLSETFITLTTPINLLPEKYTTRYKINNETYTYNFTIKKFLQWNSTLKNLSSSINILSSGVVAEVEVTNIGNYYQTILVEQSNNSKSFLTVPTSIISFSGTTISMPLTYNIQKEQAPGNYNVSVTLRSVEDNKAVTHLINLTIKDVTPPEIYNESTDDKHEVLRPTHYRFKASDNDAVSTASLNIPDVYFKELTTQADYVFNFTFNNTGQQTGLIRVVDKSGNVAEKNVTFNVQNLDAVKWKPNTVAKKKKYDLNKPETVILTTDNPVSVEIKLKSMSANYTLIRLSTKDESKDLKSINDTVTFTDVLGNVTLLVKNDYVMDYEMTLELRPPSNHVNLGDVLITGSLINYSIPENFCDNLYGAETCVEYHNTDDIERMYTEIKTVKKGSLLEKDNLGIPMTVQDKNNFIKSYTDQITELVSKNTSKLLWIIVFIVVIIILCLLLAYIQFIRPNKVVLRGFDKNNG